MNARTSWLAALALIAALGPAPAAATEPTLEVRARMRIQLEREEHTAYGGLIITGTLMDESGNEPMPGWTVALDLTRVDNIGRETAAFQHALPTDVDGGFRFEVPRLHRDLHLMRLTAGGSGAYAAPTPVERSIDMSRRDLELRLHAPSEHPVEAPTMPVVIEAVPLDTNTRFVDGRDRALPIDLDIDGHSIATIMLVDGRASTALAIPPSRIGREIVLRARFSGDDSWGPTEASVRVRIVEPSAIELSADRPRVGAGEEVALSGRLRVGGKPLAGVSVIVRRVAVPEDPGDAPFLAVKTDADGAFHAVLRAPTRSGPASFEASFPSTEAKERGLLPATSELVVVEVTPGVSFALLERRPSGLALGIFVVLSLGLLAQRSLRKRRVRKALADAALPPTAAPPRRFFGTLRMASDRRIEGRVRDAERHRPIAGARLRLKLATGEALSTITDEHGSFAFKDVAAGNIELFAEADGHAPTGTAGTVPHRGELASLELELMPLRGEMLRRYDELLAPYVVGERLGRRTPRELATAALRHAKRKDEAPLSPETVRALRKLIEERCFGSRPVGIEALAELERLAEKIPSAPQRLP